MQQTESQIDRPWHAQYGMVVGRINQSAGTAACHAVVQALLPLCCVTGTRMHDALTPGCCLLCNMYVGGCITWACCQA